MTQGEVLLSPRSIWGNTRRHALPQILHCVQDDPGRRHAEAWSIQLYGVRANGRHAARFSVLGARVASGFNPRTVPLPKGLARFSTLLGPRLQPRVTESHSMRDMNTHGRILYTFPIVRRALIQTGGILMNALSRRTFLAAATASTAALAATSTAQAPPSPLPFPMLDLHVHLDNSTIDDVLRLADERQVRFGIVEHAGTKENVYPTVLSNDDELNRYCDMLEGKPVYKGVQAEWIDWSSCFSPQALARLDYVLGDAMTWYGPDGKRRKLWEGDLEIADPEDFMERYVDWHVQLLAEQHFDILANVSWLPEAIAADYDTLWTDIRIDKVVGAAVQHGVAIEISSGFKLPKLTFLQRAKDAGAKFTFGSNGRYPKMGLLDYSIEMAQALGLTARDMFVPTPKA